MADLTETVTCPICGEAPYDVISKAAYPTSLTREELLTFYRSSGDHQLLDQLVRCRSCSLHYLNPRIRLDIVMESYSTAVDPLFFEQNPMRIATFRRALKKVQKHFSLTPDPSRKILDIGCAGGAFLKAAKDLGYEGTGVEPSAWLCEQGKRLYGLDLRPGELSQQGFGKSSFHIITLWDVLEHVGHPEKILDDIHTILDPEGYLIINVPDYDSWARRGLGKYWPFLLSVHLTYFTSATLSRLLKQHGFRVVYQAPYFQTLELGYALKRAAGTWSAIATLEKLTRTLGLDHLPLRYNMGQTTFVARKA